MSQISNLSLEAELIKIHFQNMPVQWGSTTPPRTGMHASSVLVPDQEWCTREHVLHELFPEQAVKQELHTWDWRTQAIFENGWNLHRRWQKLFRNYAKVVYELPIFADGTVGLPIFELDRTHYDETRNIYFSPDAIIEFAGQRYIVEIKGIKQEMFEQLTDNLETAIQVCETVAKARIQANLYMHLLGLKKAILLIENKNTQEFKVWVIEYDRELSVKYTQRIYDVKGATILTRMSGLVKLPQRICQSRGDARAKQCPMRDICFSKEMEG